MVVSKLENVTKYYQRGSRKFQVFTDFNLSVEQGELLVLSGPSGSGKSTLLALIGGYLKANEGKVLFAEEDISVLDDEKLSKLHSDKIGYLPQSNAMISEFTILENVMLKSLVAGKDESEEALALLDMLEIASLADKFPYELSGGELRRVAIARLLLGKPDLYLLDEPSGGLDKRVTSIVMDYLKRKVSDGATAIVATHDDLVIEYGSRIFALP